MSPSAEISLHAMALAKSRLEELTQRVQELEKALRRIARWHGEFPATDRKWDDGTPMSYGALYGSNGERDYMRQIALDALRENDRA